MENTNQNTGNKKEFIKKYLPVSSLILLTIILMLFFRYHKRDIGNLLEKGKINLLSFYTKNLQPLFETTNISNEDVFNFALYKSLPIDKKNNKVLTVSNPENNRQVFEVKPIIYNPNTNNYAKFVDYLGLNFEQKEKADSILNLYKKELYLSVLSNDQNTVVVSAKIGEIQKAVLADLLNFARNVNAEKAWQVFPVKHEFNNEVKSFIASAKETPRNEFVLITPDTAFNTICNVDSKKMEIAVNKKMNIETVPPAVPSIPKIPEAPKTNWGFNFHISGDKKINRKIGGDFENGIISVRHPDSNSFKVIVNIPQALAAYHVDDSIRVNLDKAAQKMKRLSFLFQGRNKRFNDEVRKKNDRSNKQSEVEFYFKDPSEIVNKSMEMLMNQKYKNWDEFGKQMDSFARSIAGSYSDSLLIRNKIKNEVFRNINRSRNKRPGASVDSVKNK